MPKNNDLLKGNKSKKGQAAGSGSSTSKMPKATVEQLNLALLLDKKIDVDAYEFKLQQIQECTACTKDEAIAAMHDADNNVHLAIENLLDQKSENDDWKDTVTKRSRSRKQAEVKPNVPLSAPNNTESISQNDESRSLSDLRSQKTLNSVSTKKSSAKPQAVPNLANGLSSDSLLPDSASTQPDAERDENWDLDCGEWRGEAIEVVNSASSLKVNIHEDSELLRLVTCDSPEPQQTPSDIEEIKVEDEPEKASGGALAEDRGADVSQQSKPVKASGESVESIKAWLFSTYARSAPPPSSHIPKVPVFFAPGSRNSVVSPSAQALERGTTQTQNTSPLRQLEFPCTNPPQNLEPLKSDHHPERKPRTKNQLTDASNRLKAQNQCGFSPVMTTLLHPIPKLQQDLQTDHAYSAAIQNTSALKEAYAKLQDHESPPSCPPNQPVNNFENPSPYEYNLLGELSQNIKQVGLEPQSGKSDAFTQSLSSNQPEVIMPPSYHSMQPAKPVVSQPPQINKPVSTMPPSANQQPLSTTQPQLHPAMHPGLPQLLSQFQTTFPMYNLPSGSGTAAPHLFDLDQLQALQQQQRMLFELQQSQQQQQSQSVATEPNLPNTCADVLPSSKSSVPMHHVTTPNVGHGFTFLPYHGMVLMNGYPNAFLNQQQASQNSGSPSQSSGHGGSPLTHQSNQPQYAKAMSAAPNYAPYQGLRQTNFEEMGDMFYSNLTKPIGFKHGGSGNAQGMYGVSTQQVSKAGGTDLLLTSKLQQQTSALPAAQQTSQPQPAATSNTQPQPPNQFSLYQLQYMANAAVAASVQNQHQPQTVASSAMGGPGGMVPMHARPQH